MRYASLALRRDMPRVQQWVVSPAWVVIPLDLQPTLSQKKNSACSAVYFKIQNPEKSTVDPPELHHYSSPPPEKPPPTLPNDV